jgi:ribosomal-protein-serine acetyltransferase
MPVPAIEGESRGVRKGSSMFRCPIDDEAELRLFEQRHAEELFGVIDENRAHLREWLAWVDATTSAEVSRGFIRAALDQFAAGEGFAAGLWHRGRIAGGVGTRTIDWQERKVEVGYWLSASAQGRGLATKGCRAVVDHLFRELGLNRVEIHCAAANVKSRAIAERLGFREEAVLRRAHRLQDRFVDLVVYAMLKDEWGEG